jgi:hypothetical protein
MMSRLGKHLEPVHNTFSGTTVSFRLVSKIPKELIEGLEDHVEDMLTDQCLLEIEQASSLLARDGDKLGAENLLLSKVSFLSHQNKVSRAVEEFKKIQKSWPTFLNVSQLERAREYLLNEKGVQIDRPIRLKPSYFYQTSLGVFNKIKHIVKLGLRNASAAFRMFRIVISPENLA